MTTKILSKCSEVFTEVTTQVDKMLIRWDEYDRFLKHIEVLLKGLPESEVKLESAIYLLNCLFVLKELASNFVSGKFPSSYFSATQDQDSFLALVHAFGEKFSDFVTVKSSDFPIVEDKSDRFQGILGHIRSLEEKSRNRFKALGATKEPQEIDYEELTLDCMRGRQVILGAGNDTIFSGKYRDIDVAIKEYDIDKLPAEFSSAMSLLGSLRHPNIVFSFGSSARRENGESTAYESHGTQVMERLHGESLEKKITSKCPLLPRATVVRYLTGIVRGLAYLHSRNLIHANLSPSRILFDSLDNPKIINVYPKLDLSCNNRTRATTRAPLWLAPERFIIGAKCGPESDVYSLGIIAWQMTTNKLPSDVEGFTDSKFNNGQAIDFVWPEGCCPLLKDVGQRCLQKDPSARPKTFEIMAELELLK